MAATALLIWTCAFLAGARTAEATHAEGVSITASSLEAGATDVTYTVEFSIGKGNGSTVAGQGDVSITFPAAFDVSRATFVEAESTLEGGPIAGGYATYQVDGQRLELLDFTDVLRDGTTFVLKFEGIDNPATTGTQALQMQVWNHTVGNLGSINTNGIGSVNITAPTLTAFSVTAPGGGSIGTQTVGDPFPIEVAALDDSGDPFIDLDDAAYSVDIAILGGTTGATGLGTVTLDFSSTPGTASHTITLTATQAAEAITVTSTSTPSVSGTSNAFDVVAPTPTDPDDKDIEVPDAIIEHGDTRVVVINPRSVELDPDETTTLSTEARNGAAVAVEVPGGAVGNDLRGLRLEIAAVDDQDALDRQAPPLGGADVFASFVVRLLDDAGNVVDATFDQPVTLTFTLPEGAIADAEAGILLLSYWNGTSWIQVPADAEVNDDGSINLIAEVSHFTIFEITDRPERWGRFSPTPRATGVTFSVWHGGEYGLFNAELAGGTAWALVAGEWLAYSADAPDFVNASFLEEFPHGVPDPTAIVVAM